MRYAVFVNTPAHAHMYRNFVDRVRASGDEVLVLARDRSCTLDLLDYHGIDYTTYDDYETSRNSMLPVVSRLPGQFARIARHVRRFDPDTVFGSDRYAAFAGTVCSANVVLLPDAELGETTHPVWSRFVDLVITPSTTATDLDVDHYRMDGFCACGYLLPETFTPDHSVRTALDVTPDEPLVVVQFDSLDDRDRTDDVDADRRHLVERLSERATVVVADEHETVDLTTLDATRFDLHPARMHDVLATADLLVAETGTTITEAAFVGTPAVVLGGFVDQHAGVFAAIEAAGLVRGASDLDDTLTQSLSILDDEDADDRYQLRQQAFVGELVDLNDVLTTVTADLDRTTRHGDQSVTRSRTVSHDDESADASDRRIAEPTDPSAEVETIA